MALQREQIEDAKGTSCALLQSGLDLAWWPWALACYCFLRNVIDVLHTGLTAWDTRFEAKFKGTVLPFGAEVTCVPSSPDDIAKLHKFGSKVRSGICLGYVQNAGGGWQDTMAKVSDWENLADADAFHQV